MFRCNFCTNFAKLECSGNKFCEVHRDLHDLAHTGNHKFNDVYIRLSENEKAEFGNKISLRLKTLKKYKNMLSIATAEYIKSIQSSLLHKIEEIDKMIQSYMNLIQKVEFDENDVGEIENLYSTRLTLKQLNNFNNSKFADYLQEEILLSNKFGLEDMLEEKLSLLTYESKFLFEVIACCRPKIIPESMLQGIMSISWEESKWLKAKSEIANSSIAIFNENMKICSITDLFINVIEKRQISIEINTTCLKFCIKEFVINKNIGVNTETQIKMKAMLPHTEKIVENAAIEKIDELVVILNLAKAYAYLEHDDLKLKKYLNEFILKFNLKENYMLCFEIGELYEFMQNSEEAEAFYLKCLKIQEQTLHKTHLERSQIYNKLGNFYCNKRNYEEAEKFYLQCLNIEEQALSKDYINLANIYNDIGVFYSIKPDYDKSEKFLLQCLNIFQQILPENHPRLALTYKSVGNLYFHKGIYDKAEKFLIQCLEIREKILPEYHSDRADIYNSLGRLYDKIADYKKSEKCFLQCLTIQEQIAPQDHHGLARIYCNIGDLYKKKADYQQSEKFYLLCLNIRERYLPKSHPDRATIYGNIGNLYLSKTFTRSLKSFS